MLREELTETPLTLRAVYWALDNLEGKKAVDSTRLYETENPYVQAAYGTAVVFIDAEVNSDEDEEDVDVDQVLVEDDWLQIWSPVVFNLAKLPLKKKLEIFEFIGELNYLLGTPRIDETGYLHVSVSLPCSALTPEYAAQFVSSFVQVIDEVDAVIAEKWDGLTTLDEGPDQDQGSATHARY